MVALARRPEKEAVMGSESMSDDDARLLEYERRIRTGREHPTVTRLKELTRQYCQRETQAKGQKNGSND